MNLRLRRLVRTTSSEQYALFDLDQVGAENGAPTTIGKLDLHYTAEGLYGTLLLWDDETRKLDDEQRDDLVYALLDELSMPMGVPNEYVVEFFAPELDGYSVFHNVGLTSDDELEDEVDDDLGDELEDDDGDDDDVELKSRNEVQPGTHTPPEAHQDSSSRAAGKSESSADEPHDKPGQPLPDFDVKAVD